MRSNCPSSLPAARILKPHTLNPSQGVWVLTLKEDGNLEATLEGQFISTGDYEVTGDLILGGPIQCLRGL